MPSELSFWTHGSRLENGKAGAGVAWQDDYREWRTRKVSMGINKEIFDAEFYDIDQALSLKFREII